MITHIVHHKMVNMLWPIVYPHLRKSLLRADDLLEHSYFPALLENNSSLLLAIFILDKPAICCGASILQDTGDSLHVRHLSGTMPANWAIEFNAWLEQTARTIDRPALTSQGRKGWDRVLKPLGWIRLHNGTLFKEVLPWQESAVVKVQAIHNK